MLATVAALQLLALSQVAPPPREVTPDEAAAEEAATAPAGEPAPEPPPPPPAPPADPERTRFDPPPAGHAQVSLLAGEPLRGGSAVLAWAGWQALGIMYGQGITERDDLAASLDFDWVKTELRLGGLYRRPLGTAGPFDMAGRLGLAWYLNFGADWLRDENRSDSGVELSPGLSLSRRGAGGIFSAIAEAPLTVTTKYGAGLLFIPRVSIAYEAPLYPELTLGARLGAGYRAGSGDAPLTDGRGEVTFLVLAGYQLL
jgi:hypothetical protein